MNKQKAIDKTFQAKAEELGIPLHKAMALGKYLKERLPLLPDDLEARIAKAIYDADKGNRDACEGLDKHMIKHYATSIANELRRK